MKHWRSTTGSDQCTAIVRSLNFQDATSCFGQALVELSRLEVNRRLPLYEGPTASAQLVSIQKERLHTTEIEARAGYQVFLNDRLAHNDPYRDTS